MQAGLHSTGWSVSSLDDLVSAGAAAFRAADENYRTTVAEAVLNSDPRRFSRASRRRSEEMTRFVRDAFPDMAPDDHVRIAALLRSIVSIQTWLRMREEYGVNGEEAGPVVQWALATLVREIRAGNFLSDQ